MGLWGQKNIETNIQLKNFLAGTSNNYAPNNQINHLNKNKENLNLKNSQPEIQNHFYNVSNQTTNFSQNLYLNTVPNLNSELEGNVPMIKYSKKCDKEIDIYQHGKFTNNSNLNNTHTQITNLSNLSQNSNMRTPIYSKYAQQIPQEYLLEIWETLKVEENFFKINLELMLCQKDINEKMRTILIDWIVEVHVRFNLTPETLFLTVNIIDRFLCSKQILRSKLQLIGVASLLIACKYEEILCPDIIDFVYVTDKTYNKKEILAAESEILNTLGFNLTVSTPLRFFEILSLNFNFNEIEFLYGRYLLESFLLEVKMNKYCPSLVAMSVAYLIMKVNNYSNYQELYLLLDTKNINTNYNSKVLKECAREIYCVVQNAECSNFKAVYRKYSTAELYQIAINGMNGI